MTEGVAHVVHLRDGFAVLEQVRLHRVIHPTARLEREIDGDALMADAREDLAHGLHRFGAGGHAQLQPAARRHVRVLARAAIRRPSRP
jgi:hypothetical protein